MGSPNGIWTAVSGAMAQSQNVDAIANNLANANTTGFKKDMPTFKEFLTAQERPTAPIIDIPRTIFKDSEFYNTDGRENTMVNVDKVVSDHTQGNFKITNSPYDIAVDGPGFIAVKTPAGLMFTRAGDFKVNADGKLVTNDGFEVLGLSQQAEQQAQQQAQLAAVPGDATTRAPASVNPFMMTPEQLNAKPDPNDPAAMAAATQKPLDAIDLKDMVTQGKRISVTAEGDIYAGNEKVAKLAIAEFADPKLLKKETSTMYSNPNAVNVPKIATLSKARQGFLEMSNVNAVSEMVNLIKANRMFESNMRAIKTYSEMSGKEANEVGKL